jgi:hypothetical protein
MDPIKGLGLLIVLVVAVLGLLMYTHSGDKQVVQQKVQWTPSLNVPGDTQEMVIGGFSDPRYLSSMRRVPFKEAGPPQIINEI